MRMLNPIVVGKGVPWAVATWEFLGRQNIVTTLGVEPKLPAQA